MVRAKDNAQRALTGLGAFFRQVVQFVQRELALRDLSHNLLTPGRRKDTLQSLPGYVGQVRIAFRRLLMGTQHHAALLILDQGVICRCLSHRHVDEHARRSLRLPPQRFQRVPQVQKAGFRRIAVDGLSANAGGANTGGANAGGANTGGANFSDACRVDLVLVVPDDGAVRLNLGAEDG